MDQKSLEQLPRERGFRLRGLEMTRIEVFVDAAFAFAVTMLVISFDEIPRTFDDMLIALKGIPAFVVSVAQLMWIWYEHNTWSRRYGLEDRTTVVLSAALLIAVLIFIYPLRVMAQGMFSWFTGGFLPSSMRLESTELAFMFVIMGAGFSVLCAILALMYRHAWKRRAHIMLSPLEAYATQTMTFMWWGFAAVGLISATLALLVPTHLVPWTGFSYFLLSLWGAGYGIFRGKRQPEE